MAQQEKLMDLELLDNPSLASAFGLLSYATNHSLEGEKDEKFKEKKSTLSVIYQF